MRHFIGKPYLRGRIWLSNLKRELRLRMQRGRHVDGVGIALGALEPDVFGAGVGADPLEEFRQPHALPRADGAPALDADVAGDLRHLRQRVELVERPRLLVVDQAADFELVGLAVDLRRLVLGVVAVERERPRDRAFGIFRRQRVRIEQQRLDAIVEFRNLSQHAFGGVAVDDVAAGRARRARRGSSRRAGTGAASDRAAAWRHP